MTHQVRAIVPSYVRPPQIYTIRFEQTIVGVPASSVDKCRSMSMQFMVGANRTFESDICIDWRVLLCSLFMCVCCVCVYTHTQAAFHFISERGNVGLKSLPNCSCT